MTSPTPTMAQTSLFPTMAHQAEPALVADIWVNAEGASFTPFTYAIPDDTAVLPGMAVAVPFGRQAAVTGFVLAIRPRTANDPSRLRSIETTLSDSPILSPTHWAVLAATAHDTVTPLATVLQAALPPKLLGTGKTVIALNAERLSHAPLGGFDQASQQVLRTLLASSASLTPVTLAKRANIASGTLRPLLKKLQQQGLVMSQLDWQQPSQGRLMRVVTPTTETLTEELTLKQQTALAEIQAQYRQTKQPIPRGQLAASDSILRALSKKKAIHLQQCPVAKLSSALSIGETASKALPTLTPAQRNVVATIQQTPPTDNPWLIHGVTGSGKTAVYLHLAHQILQQGKQVLLLVPEIALTAQLAQRVRAVFPQAAVWHSNIADGERIQLWQRLHAGEPLLVLGARSAVLLPLPHVGLIVLDEAHDASFKQETPAPRYHAEAVARHWAQKTGATLVFGSATPDLTHLTQAEANGTLLTLPERYGNQSLASVTCVDMKTATHRGAPGAAQGTHGVTSATSAPSGSPPSETSSPSTPSETLPKPSLIAPQTLEALNTTLAQGHQAMVLINRRGYHTLVQCQSCGQVHQCNDCDVALTYHRPQRASSTATPKGFGEAAYVLCHHCGYRASAPDYCPSCASRQLRLLGTGSQRVVEALEQALPQARIVRLDRDIQQKRHAPEAILTAFANHQADILVGTQMIAKGLDIANVTLVVVLQADAALMLPDYRASERAFQLLTQVAGRSGRGQHAGHVLVQTWQPEHPVIQLAAGQDYTGFVAYERPIREALGFPPYARLYRYVISGEDDSLALAYANALAERLKAALLPTSYPVEVLGPAPCVIGRVQGWYRFHILLKIRSQETMIRENVHCLISELTQTLQTRSGLRVLLDVDAISLL